MSERGIAQAEVVKPVRVISLADLSFGSIAVSSNAAGTVRVAADGSPAAYERAARPECTGQAQCAPHRASFDVTGEAGRAYSVALPASVTAIGQRTGAPLLVGALEMYSLNAPSLQSRGLLNESGRDTFFVGGVLQLPAGTRPDLFRAELSVTVSYN
jgi:hypothetical protein